MNGKFTKSDYITLAVTTVVTLLPMLAGLALYNRLPAQIPIHWNIAGEIDGYGPRAAVVFGLPLFMAAIGAICQVVTLADPRRSNTPGKIRTLVFWIVPVLSVVVNTMTLFAGLGRKVDIEVVTPLLIGVLFIVLGNYMPKVRQNYTVGIKLPWTLHSEENWRRTHRLGGWLYTLCGLVMMAAALIGTEIVIALAVGTVLIAALVPMVYSYVLYKKGV